MTKKNKNGSVVDLLERRTFFAAVSINIDTAKTYQTIEGLGAAMIPWSNMPEYKSPAFFDLIANDLGASMVRAAILPGAENVNDNADPNTFNWAGFNAQSLESPFSFFQQMKARGVNKFVGTVWTAPAWMKTNQMYTDGGSLRADDRAEFAEYLAAVVDIGKNTYGINMDALSIQNEPYFVEPYESTTYTADQMRETIRAAGRKFAAEGINTKLLAPEDLIFPDRIDWYTKAIMEDPETAGYLGAVAGHGLANRWQQTKDVLAPYGKEFWMTETSGNSATWTGAMGVASTIFNALGTANASTYLYWQFSDAVGNESYTLMSAGQPTQKYYAAKQFYRYIRPGFKRVDATSSVGDLVRVNSFKDPVTGAMTTVLMNTQSETQDLTFNLSGLNLPGTYKVFRSSDTENMVSLGTITGGSNFTLNMPAYSIITITNAPELAASNVTTAMKTISISKPKDYVNANNFFLATYKGYINSVTAQINGGADVNQRASNGWTPLITASGSVYDGALNTLNKLIASGADATAKSNEGWTGLHAAAANSFSVYGAPATFIVDKMNALLAAGANVNAVDNTGKSPLHWAGMMGKLTGTAEDLSVVTTLINAGANPNLKDAAGKTAYDYAVQEGHGAIAAYLLSKMGPDTVKPTADIIDVSPDPRTTSVESFIINFSEVVNGVDKNDFTLTRNGANVALPAGASISTGNNISYVLAGMGTATSTAGSYVLTLKSAGTGIKDGSNNPFDSGASDSWANGTVPPPPPADNQTPFKGTPFAIGTAGPTTIEFEDFDNGGEGVAYSDIDTANKGGGYRANVGVDIVPIAVSPGAFQVGYTKAGEWMEYTVNVAQAGNYDLTFRVASAVTGGLFHLERGGVNITGSIAVPKTGGWETWTNIVKSNIALPAGQSVLRLSLDSLGTSTSVGNFDYMRITPTSPPPPPPPQATQLPYYSTPFAIGANGGAFQAEDFDRGGEGVAYHDLDAINSGVAYRTDNAAMDVENTGDTGGGKQIGFTKKTEWAEYTIDVANTGTYTFDVRTASKYLGAKFKILVDGVDKTGALDVPNTGSWSTFATVSKTGVSLTSGQHVVRLSFESNGESGYAGNYNWIKITPTNVQPPPPPPPPAGGTTLTNSKASYVRGGSFAGQNFGSDSTIIVKKHATAESSREAYLQFDLSGVSTINSAKLRLFGSAPTSTVAISSQVFGGATTAWDEATLTWNNKPGIVGNALATASVTGDAAKWYEFDVTTFLKAEKAAGRSTVTLVLRDPNAQSALVVFNSDDSATNKPQLVLT